MQQNPRYGYFPRWPQEGDDWLHPEDTHMARKVLPSYCIWRRESTTSEYDRMTYGTLSLRVLPAMWVEVKSEGIDVNDWVEVKSRLQQNTYRIARVREVRWDLHASAIRYQVESQGMLIPSAFGRADLRLLRSPPIPQTD